MIAITSRIVICAVYLVYVVACYKHNSASNVFNSQLYVARTLTKLSNCSVLLIPHQHLRFTLRVILSEFRNVV